MSQPQLRPNATVATTGLAVTGGASADVVLDDAPATDSTFVGASGSAAATATMNLTDPTWPAGAVSRSARIQLRGKAGANPGRGVAELRNAGVVVASFDNKTWTSTSTWVTKIGAWYPINLTQAEVNALQVWIRLNKSQANPYNILCSEVYVDLILAERATAAITTATTAYTSSTITTDWSHTPGADGGDQSHFRVMVLTAAQVATVTGGDPLTSTAGNMFDTGDVEGAQASYTATGIPALTAGAARYVRTADLVNGVPHWSAWTSQGITNTLTTAEVLSIVPAADSANGRVSVVVNRDTAKDPWTAVEVDAMSGVNVIGSIGAMEGAPSGGVAGGWFGGALAGTPTGVTWSTATVAGHGQVQRVVLTTAAASSVSVQPFPFTAIPVAAGDRVQIFADFNSTTWNNNAPAVAMLMNTATGFAGWQWLPLLDRTTGWRRYTGELIVPANVTSVTPFVGVGDVGGASVSTTVDIDNVTAFVNGTWAALTVPSPGTNSVTVQDYTSPPGATIAYRARARNAGGSLGARVYSPDITWTMAGAEEVWLKAPGRPWLNMRPWVTVRPLENSRPRRQQVFQLLDDDTGQWAREVVTNGRLGGRVTSLVVRTETLAQAAQLLELAKVGVIDVHPPASWRFAPGRFVLADLSEDVGEEIGTDYEYQLWTIEIREVV